MSEKVKISEFEGAISVSPSYYIPAVYNGENYKVSVQQLLDLMAESVNDTVAGAIGIAPFLSYSLAQSLSAGQKTTARSNLGLGALAVLSSLTQASQINDSLITVAKLATEVIATQAQAEAGTSDANLMTPLKTRQAILTVNPASFGTSGWEKSASGRIIQWGFYSGGSNGPTITFPTTFPTACRCVLAVMAPASAVANNTAKIVMVSGVTTSGFVASQRYIVTAAAVDPDNFYWIAIGN